MKQVILPLKKCFSLILSIYFLFTDITVFAQEKLVPNVMAETKIVELQRRMEALSKKLKKAEISFNNLLKSFRNAPHYMDYLICDDGDHIVEMEAAKQKWHKALNNPTSQYYKDFKAYQAEMNKIFDEFSAVSSEVNYAHKFIEEETAKKVIERLSYKYSGKAPSAYPQGLPLVDDIAIKHYRNILTSSVPSDLTKIEKEFEGMYTYLNIRINLEGLEDLTATAKMALKIDNRAELFISQQIKKPQEIIMYAYNNIYQEGQRYAVKIALEAEKEGTGLVSTVIKIQRYMRNFGTGNVNKMSFFRLLREMRPLTRAARVEYVKKITGLSKGEKQLLADIANLENKEKFINKMLYGQNTKIAGKTVKGLTQTGILLGIGSVLAVFYIMNIDAHNNFSNSLDIPGLQAAIERGESTPEEELLFYTSEDATSVICENSFHTIKMLETFDNVMRANFFSQEIAKENEIRAEVENLLIDHITDFSDLEVNLA